jgi:hypothetical protein
MGERTVRTLFNTSRHTHAGGREIHIAPGYSAPDPSHVQIPRPILLGRFIYPRRMLTANDINIIRTSDVASLRELMNTLQVPFSHNDAGWS